uniref:GP63-like protein n=1 Tax=Coptotermes formosanus TaxID=36987 RepID=R4UL14_COPFO|nr:GP63-like protein [Coptotermes formosanus]
MGGVSFSGSTITELTFVAMLDTGWYIPDFRGAKRLLWGWGPSFSASNLTTFLMEPFDDSFPEHYICKNWGSKSCTWNYRGFGPCRRSSIDCSSSEYSSTPWCQGIEFYDPNRTGYYPNLNTINTYYVRPYSDGQCWNSQSSTIGAGQNAFCHVGSSGNPSCIDTFCNPNGTLTLKDSDNVAICSKAGESVTLGSRTIICSNPVHV